MPINGKYTPYEKKRVENAIQYIHEHYTEDISADGLALEVRIDIKHLQKVIKKLTGYTVHHYLLKVRIEHSLSELLDFQKSIDLISSKLGFRDHRHFDRVFKKYIGKTPSQYRSDIIDKENHV